MARLILNDFRLNSLWLLVVFLFYNIDLDLLVSLSGFRYRIFPGPYAGFFFASVMILVLLMREEYNKGQVIYRSLPLSNLKIVSARYASICLIILACMLYGYLFQHVIIRFSPQITRHVVTEQMDAGYALEHSLIARAIAVTTILAIAIPLIMRFSMFWGMLVGYLACLFVWPRLIDHLLEYSLHTSFFLGLSRWMFFSMVSMVVALGLSVRLSVWLYGQRDL